PVRLGAADLHPPRHRRIREREGELRHQHLVLDLVRLAPPPVHDLGPPGVPPLHDPDDGYAPSIPLPLEPSPGLPPARFQRSAGEEGPGELLGGGGVPAEEVEQGGVAPPPYSG